jgi:transcriptional regulator with XRE-family HTH domain
MSKAGLSEKLLQNKILQELASLIFIYRKKNKITLQELSNQTSNDIKFLSNLERGKHDTQITNYFKIAKVLKIPSSAIGALAEKYFKETI